MRGFLAQGIMSPTDITLLQVCGIIDNVGWRNTVINLKEFSPRIVIECLAIFLGSGGRVMIRGSRF